jgi:signal transduction histidine kinase
MKTPTRMRIQRSTLMTAAAGAFLMVLLTVNAVMVFGAWRQLKRVPSNPPAILRQAIKRCAEDPASWRSFQEGRLRFDAYDGGSFAPADVEGTPLDRRMVSQLGVTERTSVQIGYLWGFGSRVLWRHDAGPCGVIQVEARPTRRTTTTVAWVVLSALAMAVMGLLTAWMVVLRPLRSRVARLAKVAEVLDEASGRGQHHTGTDDIETIASALEVSITKHGEANVQLALRAERLERHLAELAHDLRTPLASLQLALERMTAETSADEHRRLLGRCLTEHVYVTTLLDNLDAATTLEGNLSAFRAVSELDLGMLVEGVVARFSLLAEQNGIELVLSRPDQPVPVLAAPTLLERGLGNLVHNAIRHGTRGGHVAVLLVLTDASVILTVEDDGPGMSEALLASLGSRGESALRGVPRADGSRGIGLAVAMAAFDRAGMRLTFRRAPTGGLVVKAVGARSDRSP